MPSLSTRLFNTLQSSLIKNQPIQKKHLRKSRLLAEVLEDRVVPANFTPGDLVVLQAAASANNTTASILELSPNTANQASPALTVGISGTGTNAVRISGSASTTGYLADSNDGTYLVFTGANSTNTSSNANTLNPRAVVALNNAATVTLPASYDGTSGNQTRGASTLDDSDWYIGDQGGIYTNSTSTPSPSGNFRSVKTFGGNVYAFTASATSPPVGTLSSPSGSTFTPLPGLQDGTTNAQDFYLIQSGSNGSTFDVLYVLSATSATAGTVSKYSLVNGSWSANGSYTTSFGGFGLTAANNGSGGASLYVTTGTGATTANQVIEFTDTTGFNTTINITTANNVTLYTAAAGALLKGIAFAPVSATATTAAITNISPLSASTAQTVTLTATVTANSGSVAPATGIVEFINSGASGTILATATEEITSGATSTFNVTTSIPAGSYSSIQAYYIANTGSNFSSSISAVYTSTLAVGTATTTAITSISPTSTIAGQPVSFTATVSAATGSTAPSAGSVQFRNGGATGTLLATATSETVNGSTSTFSVTTSSIAAGNYSDIQAFYIGGTGFVSSNSSDFSSTLILTPPGVIAEWNFPATASAPDNSPAPTFGSGAAITLGMTNDYNSGNTASDDVLLTSGSANPNFSENTWRIRGVLNNGWATAAAGAAEYTQGIEVDTSTVGHSNIVFSFDWYSTTEGIRDLQVQYNTNTANPNGWTNYKGPSPTGTFVATADDFYNADLSPVNPTITINLGSISAANNDPNLGIRLVSAFDSTGNVPNDYASATLGSNGQTVIYNNTSGNWRFGNLTFAYGTTTSTAVSATPASTQAYGGNVTLNATVTPASGSTNPSGTVAFYDGSTQIGTIQTLTNGSGNTATASITLDTLTVGTQDITAQYIAASGSGFINSGSSMNLTTGTNPLAYNITGINTNSVVTASLPSPEPLFTLITFTDTITPVSGSAFPTGTVKFYDDGSKIGSTQTVAAGIGNTGTASIAISTLTLGDQDITAEYFPTGDFGSSTSSILEEKIIPSLSTPIISEFVASNHGDLLDAAGDSNDWIEIYNPTATAIDLYDYSLTTSAGNLTQWQFPQYTLAAGGYLVVFADSEDITTGTELHTNFNLPASGGYLALVDPNGNIISQYQYTQQEPDVSYGVNFNTTNLISAGANAQTLIPTNNSLGTSWTAPSYNPSGWINGTTGVGFGIVEPGFNVTYVQANESIPTVETAEEVLTTPSLQTNVVNTNAPTINYFDTGVGGDFTSSEVAFPTQTEGVEVDDFMIQATGAVAIPTAGNWSFAVNSDDGFELTLSQGSTVFTSEFDGLRGAADTVATFNLPQGGNWNLSLIYFQNAGGASVDLSAAKGAYTTFTPGAFELIGDTVDGGLAIDSVPGSDSSLLIGTNVASAMQNINSSAYIRIPFTVANPSAFNQLSLAMQYNDGFVAYLNGVEVASANAPATLAYNSTATAQQTIIETVTPQDFSLTPYLGLLQTGTNVLAIQGLNSSTADSSFLVLPELTATDINTGQLSYFVTPSPDAPNTDPSPGVAGTVAASVPDGFYTNAITVTLSTPTPGATIYYTTNGSAPTMTNGTLYTGPLSISSTTTLRAEAVETGYITLPSVTWTYIYVADVMTQSLHDAPGYPELGPAPAGWPTTWGPNDVNYGLDETAIQEEGAANVQAGLQALPVIAISTDLSGLFNATTGIYANANVTGVKVPASIELINPDGVPGFQINAGLSIRGGASRESGDPKHSFHITFSTDYGPSTLDYPLFGDQPGVATSFQGIDLRTEQNNSWNENGDPNATMMEDPFVRGTMGAMGQVTTHSIWVNLYIDGQYWGIYEIEERIDPLFASTYLGTPKTDTYDILRAENGSYSVGVEYGNTNAYYQLWQYVTTNNMANNANYYFIQGDNPNGTPNPSIPNSDVLLNVDNLIDYMITVYQSGDEDAPISSFLGNTGINNFFAIRDENGREGFVFLQHDAEWTYQSVDTDRIGPYSAGGPGDFDHFNPQYLFQVLMANAEFRQTFADIVQADFTGDGVMTNANMLARYEANATDISVAINAESARWGDSQSLTSPFTISNWEYALNSEEYILENRNAVVLQQFEAAGWISTLAAPQYLVNGGDEDSGQFTAGSLLTFANTGGVIYFTTDGSDPREVGGGINPLAQEYIPGQTNPALVLNDSIQIEARALEGSTWSALSEATLSDSVPAAAGNLAITELQYDPLPDVTATTSPDDDAQNFEYIELRNISSQSIDLAGVQFTQGITFNFSLGSVLFLNPGQSIVVVSNLQAFDDRYGTYALIAGVYSGNLSDNGETVTLLDATGAVIQSFAYSDSSSWPQTPHGQGPSLTVINVDGNYDDPANWRASYATLGTPGYNEGVDTAPQDPPTDLQPVLSGYTSTSTAAATISNLLTWTGLSDATGYIIERMTGANGTYEQIGTTTEPSYDDSGLTPGNTYYYQICGVNAVGPGPFSTALVVTIPAVPTAPTAAHVTGSTANSVSLSWTDNANNEDGFQVFRSSGGGTYTLAGSAAADTSPAPSTGSYTDTGLTPGVTYQYEIVAFNVSGASAFTSTTTTTLLAAPSLVFAQRNNNTATLFFTAPAGVTSYNIYRGTASGQETLFATNVSGSPYTDSTLQTGVTYFYYVTAVNANAIPAPNESAPSNEASPAVGGSAYQWTGAGTNNNWTTPGNWLGGIAPTGNANETLIFPAGGNQLACVDNFPAGSNYFGDIIISRGGYSFTINNNLALGSGGILANGTGTETISGATSSVDIYLAASATFNVAIGDALVVNTPVQELTYTLTIAGAGTDTFTGAIAGSGGLVIASQGTVALNGSSTYTGATQINSGTVNLGSNTALGVNNDVTIAKSATVALQGMVTQGVGLMGQYYNVTPASADFVNLPTLTSYISTLTPSLTELSATTSLNGNFDFNSSGSAFPAPYNANAIDFIAVYTGLFDAATAGSYTFDTGSDDGSMLFIDGNVVVNNNNFQGVTVVSGSVTLTASEHNIVIAYYQGGGGYGLYADVQTPGGTLERLPDSLLSAVAPTNVQFGSLSGAGTLQLGANQITIGGNGHSSVFTGMLSGGGDLTKVGAGTLILDQPQYTGTTAISGGTLQFGDGVNSVTALPTSSIADNATIGFDNPAGAALTYAQVISGSGGLMVSGGGTLYLNAANTYQGATVITAGIVDALNNAAIGNNSAVTVDQGAALNFSGLVASGLSGTYYSSAPNNPTSAAFDSLSALTAYVATLPVLTTDSTATSNGQNDGGNYFDYGSTGAGFPATILNNPNQFIGIWSGEFNAQVAGSYTFTTASDDGSMIYIDGNVVVNNNNYQGVTTQTGSVSLTAGYHNIVIAYYQGGGGYGLYANVEVPGGTLQPLPNSLLVDSNSQINFGSLSGGGNVTVSSSTMVSLTIGSNNSNTIYSGILAGFTELTKVGTGTLTMSNTNTYLGGTVIDAGKLVAAANGALGNVAVGTTVNSGSALAISGGINYSTVEPVTITGSGPAGNGAIENISGINSFAGPITLSGVSTIGSDAGQLTLGGAIAAVANNLTFTGAGNTVVNGVISSSSVVPGLTEGQLNANIDLTDAPSAAYGTDIVLSPEMGETNSVNDNDNTPLPTSSHTWTNNDEWIYTGQIYFPPNANNSANAYVSFAKTIDDDTYLQIDNTVIFDDTNWQNSVGSGVLTFPAGWNTIDLRMSNGGGGAGADGQNNNGWNGFTTSMGFVYRLDTGPTDPLGGGTATTLPVPNYQGEGETDPHAGNVANYTIPIDNGTGNVFRTASSPSIIKNGAGTVIFNAAESTSSTTVNAGTLIVDSTLTSPVTLSGGVLGGTGTVQGAATIGTSGTLTAGNSLTSAGKLTTQPIINGTLNVYLNGNTAGTGYGQIVTTGTTAVSLGASSAIHINIGPAIAASPPAIGTLFDVLSNSTGKAISGTFAGLAQGAVVFDSSGVYKFTVSYTGGTTSHDLVLTYQGILSVTSVSPTSDIFGAGTTVTIAGTNFTGATAVMFGTTPAKTFTVNSATKITATAPAEVPGTVDVTVAVPLGGLSALSPADHFTYTSNSTTTLTESTSTSVYGQTITLTASVAAVTSGGATLSGSVQFSDGSNVLGTVSLIAGSATFTTNTLVAGSHSLTAAYTGSTVYFPSTSNTVTEAVSKSSTSVKLVSSGNPAIFGSVITFTANISVSSPGSGVPTGSVTFYDGIAPLATESLVAGSTTFTTSSLMVGTHSITANYTGDSNFQNSTSAAINQVINAPAPAVSSVVINPGEGAAGSDTFLGNSRVLSIQVTFSTAVNTTTLASAFSLTRAGLPNGVAGDNATIGTITVATSTNGSGDTVATLTFSGMNTEGNSLADGNWTLGINATDVTNNGTPMASNYTQTGILRLFGDYTGSGTVASNDLGVLGTTFGLGSNSSAFIAAFDSDGNGEIDSTDLGRFGINFGLSI